MANKQPHRQRFQPKIYTQSDFDRGMRAALAEVEKQHMKLSVGSFALVLHRKLGLNSDEIGDILVATNEYSMNALCFQDVRKELLEEAGLDLNEYVEEI